MSFLEGFDETTTDSKHTGFAQMESASDLREESTEKLGINSLDIMDTDDCSAAASSDGSPFNFFGPWRNPEQQDPNKPVQNPVHPTPPGGSTLNNGDSDDDVFIPPMIDDSDSENGDSGDDDGRPPLIDDSDSEDGDSDDNGKPPMTDSENDANGDSDEKGKRPVTHSENDANGDSDEKGKRPMTDSDDHELRRRIKMLEEEIQPLSEKREKEEAAIKAAVKAAPDQHIKKEAAVDDQHSAPAPASQTADADTSEAPKVENEEDKKGRKTDHYQTKRKPSSRQRGRREVKTLHLTFNRTNYISLSFHPNSDCH